MSRDELAATIVASERDAFATATTPEAALAAYELLSLCQREALRRGWDVGAVLMLGTTR